MKNRDYKDHGKKPYVLDNEDAILQNDNVRTTIWMDDKISR